METKKNGRKLPKTYYINDKKDVFEKISVKIMMQRAVCRCAPN